MRSSAAATVLVLGAVLCACSADDSGKAPDVASPTTAASASVFESPSLDDSFDVGDGVELALKCWGKGSPVVILEGGSGEGGLERWDYNPVTEAVARHTEVCAYDRAGTGSSDAAPDRKREIGDVVADLHALLDAAEIPGPYVLAGVSGGGFYAYEYAGMFPDEAAGIVMIDTPPGQAKMSPEDVKGLAWDTPDNNEHVDYVAVEHHMAVARRPIPSVPVTVVTATDGQSADDPASQKVWLAGASPGKQVTLTGTHDIDRDDPDGVSAAVLEVVDAAS